MSQDGSPSRTMTTSLVQLYSFGDDVAEAKGVEYSSGPSYKTDLRALAHDLGVDRVELRDMEGDALTIKRPDGRYTMFLNGSHYRARHRFSAAHEMAHILLSSMLSSLPIHRHRFSPDQDPDGKRVEALCDSMASSILMPRRRIDTLIALSGSSARCVPQIADNFGVSFEAAARRFVVASPSRFAVLFWKPQGAGQFKYLKHPVVSTDVRASWGKFVPPSHQGHLSASRAMDISNMVDSRESVVLWYRKGKKTSPQRLDDAQVESFGQSRGRFRHVASFVHVP